MWLDQFWTDMCWSHSWMRNKGSHYINIRTTRRNGVNYSRTSPSPWEKILKLEMEFDDCLRSLKKKRKTWPFSPSSTKLTYLCTTEYGPIPPTPFSTMFTLTVNVKKSVPNNYCILHTSYFQLTARNDYKPYLQLLGMSRDRRRQYAYRRQRPRNNKSLNRNKSKRK